MFETVKEVDRVPAEVVKIMDLKTPEGGSVRTQHRQAREPLSPGPLRARICPPAGIP